MPQNFALILNFEPYFQPMNQILKTLPSGINVNVAYVGDLSGSTAYLHYKRYDKRLVEGFIDGAKQQYEAMLALKTIPSLKYLIEAFGVKFDTLVVIPSSCNDMAPYLETVKQTHRMRDISSLFRKAADYRARDCKAGMDEVVKNINYQSDQLENEINGLLILDDSVGTGKTVNSIILHLLKNGMGKDVPILVATPLLVA